MALDINCEQGIIFSVRESVLSSGGFMETEVHYSKCTLKNGEERIKALLPSCFASKGNSVTIDHKFYVIDSISPIASNQTVEIGLLVKEIDDCNVPTYPVLGHVKQRSCNNYS